MELKSVFASAVTSLVLTFPAVASSVADRQEYVKAMYSLPLTLDPIEMNDVPSLVVGNLLYDGLLRFSPTLKLEGALAESWSTSVDGKVLTFQIRKDATFHNGRSVTAEDVVASFRRAILPPSKVAKYYDCIEGADEFARTQKPGALKLSAIDSHVVEIRLTHPFPPFLSVLAGATAKVLPAQLLSVKGFFNAPIGSGPFRFVEKRYGPVKQIILSAFSGYHGGPPALDRIILRELSETDALKAAERGEANDLSNYPLSATKAIFRIGQKIVSPQAATWIVGLNTRAAPFNNNNIRRQFRADFNTESFRKLIFPDAIAAYGYVPPGIQGNRTVKRESLTRIIPPKTRIRLVIPAELEGHETIKEVIESQMKAKGWNVEAVAIAWDVLMKGYSEKSHQAFLVSMNMDYPDVEFLLRNFESTNPDNFSGLADARLDQLLQDARSERDRQRRQKLYQSALEIIDSAAVTINLFHPRANYWVSDCVSGFVPNILSDVYINYRNVKLKDGCQNKVAAK